MRFFIFLMANFGGLLKIAQALKEFDQAGSNYSLLYSRGPDHQVVATHHGLPDIFHRLKLLCNLPLAGE